MTKIVYPTEKEVLRFGRVVKRAFRERFDINLNNVMILPEEYHEDALLAGNTYVAEKGRGLSYILRIPSYQYILAHELEHIAFYRALLKRHKTKKEAFSITCDKKELNEGISELVSLDELTDLYSEETLEAVEKRKNRFREDLASEDCAKAVKEPNLLAFEYRRFVRALGYQFCSTVRKAFPNFNEMQRFLVKNLPTQDHILNPELYIRDFDLKKEK